MEQPQPVPYLVVIVKAESGIRTLSKGVTSVKSTTHVSSLNKILEEHGVSLNLMFGLSEDRIKRNIQELQRKTISSIIKGNENQEAAQIFGEVSSHINLLVSFIAVKCWRFKNLVEYS
jgi:hypothetical protein